MPRLLLAALAAVLTLSACDSSDPAPTPQPLNVQTVADVNADFGPRNPTTGQVAGTGRFAFYSLRENRLVLGVDNANRADSASTAWDIAFRGTTILVNGGTSGPGQGAAQIVATSFADLTEAPADGYRVDGDAANDCPAVQGRPGAPYAICTGSGNGWYTYVPFSTGGGYIVPTPGRTIVVRNADGVTYSKVRVLSYYQGNPDPASITSSTPERYYTFEFVVQPDGSRNFETTILP